MNESKYASVTITFDGMMLFHFDEPNSRCEVMFRDVHGHEMEVIVKKEGSKESRRLTHDELSGYDRLWLYVENQGEKLDYKMPGNAECGGWYKSILQLDGADFYESLGALRLKSGRYKPTMYVCDGCVGADNGNSNCKDEVEADNGREKDKNEKWGLSRVEDDRNKVATCYRVQDTEQDAGNGNPKYSFKELKYDMSNQDWQLLKNSYKGIFIKGLNPFLRWVNTNIDLSPGQNLMLMGESDNEPPWPFSPLITNYQESDAYWIHIKYTDSDTPDSLEDCKGMGHHCEAFECNGQPLYPLYSVFSPKIGLVDKPTAPWEPQIRSSDVPCCLSVCVNQDIR
jgi:hypothetical protein